MSVERFISVCYPLQARLLCTRKNVKIFIILSILASCSLNLTRYFEREVIIEYGSSNDTSTNETIQTKYNLQETPHKSSMLGITLKGLLHVINIAIPLVILIYCNVRILIRVTPTN